MTVKELKQKLDQYTDDMDVFIDERVSEFNYGLLNSVISKEIDFMEESCDHTLSQDTVVILSEE